jgi:hypothetical protein
VLTEKFSLDCSSSYLQQVFAAVTEHHAEFFGEHATVGKAWTQLTNCYVITRQLELVATGEALVTEVQLQP